MEVYIDLLNYNEKIKDVIFFDTIKKYKKELIAIEKKEEETINKIHTARGNREIYCLCCVTKYKIKDLVYIQTYYYVPPRGCTEGDYHVPQGGYFICPSCNVRNMFINKSRVKYDDLETMKNPVVRFDRYYKPLFKERIDENKEHKKLSYVNMDIGIDFLVEK